MFKKIKFLVMGTCFFAVPFISINAMEKRQNKIEIRQENSNVEFKNTVDEYIKLIFKKTDDFKLKWNEILMNFEIKKETFEENLEKLALTYFEVAKDIHLDEEKYINLDKVNEDLWDLNFNFCKCKLDEKDIDRIKIAFIEQFNVVDVALKDFNEKHKEYENRLKEKISEKFYAKNKIKQFERIVREKANEFGLKWCDYVSQFKQNKKNLSDGDIKKLAFLYVKFEKNICLNDAPNPNNREIDEEKVYRCLAEFDKVFLKYKLDKKDKVMLSLAYKQQLRKINECLDFFEKMFYRHMKELNEKIIEIKEENSFVESINTIKTTDEDRHSLKKKVKAYIEILNDDAKTFEKIWNGMVPSFVTKEGIWHYEIERFATIYVLLADDIFLDENGNVDEENFLKKIKIYDSGVYNYKLTNEEKEELKQAFMSKIILINGTIKTCCREFLNFRVCKKKIGEAINKKLHSNVTIDFVEKLFKNFMKGKIKTYLKALLLASKQFKKYWDLALSELDLKEELSPKDLDKLVSILPKLTDYIFLDTYGDVDTKNFRERLGTTTKNNFKIMNGFISIYTLDEIDEQELKEAFTVQINVIREALKQFYEKHIKYKDKLNAKINEELPLKIRINIAGKTIERPKKQKIKKGEGEANSEESTELAGCTIIENLDVNEYDEEDEKVEDEKENEEETEEESEEESEEKSEEETEDESN